MTDKEKKSKIADILLEFYDEYQCNMPNRPMIPSLYASKIIDSLQEEPVSDDLEKAANEWDAKASFTPFYMVMNGDKPIDVKQDITTHADSFKAGAQWQKTKDESITEDLGEYINELSKQFPEVSFAKLSRIAVRVAKWQKELMMAKAIDCEVHQTNVAGIKLDSVEICSDGIMLDNTLYKEGDKVKVIVIKEN